MNRVCLLFLIFAVAAAAAPARADYWVDYTFSEFQRGSDAQPWQLRYSAPFGVRIPYGTGFIAAERTITDPHEANCFDFAFTPTAADGTATLYQTIEVTKYHGDAFCQPDDPKAVINVATIKMAVGQNQTTTFYFPFFKGLEAKMELKAVWKTVAAEAPRP